MTAVKKEGLHAKVKQIQENSFEASEENGRVVIDRNKPSSGGGGRIIKFSEKGNYVEMCVYSNNPYRKSKIVSTYNNKAQVINIKYYVNDTLVNETVNKYNDKGNMIESCVYKADGSLASRTITKFDAKENQTESFTFSAEIIRYNEKGKPVKTLNKDTSHVSRIVYKYDDKGRLIEQRCYNEEDSLVISAKNTFGNTEYGIWTKNYAYQNIYGNSPFVSIDSVIYYKKGTSLKSYNYNVEKGKIILKSFDSTVYDKKGRIIEKIKIAYDGLKSVVGLMQAKYKYSKNGSEEDVVNFKKGDLDNKQTTTKDKKGRALEIKRSNKNGDLTFKSTNKYDTQGNIIEMTSWREKDKNHNEFNSSDKFLNEYDKKGNWIKRTHWSTVQNKIIVFIREIEYY